MKSPLSILLLTVVLSSCVMHEERPESWSNLAEDCSAVAGSYRTVGVSVSNSHTPNLGHILFALSTSSDSIVTFEIDSTKLKIELIDAGTSLKTSTVSYSCHGGMVVFTPKTEEGFINRDGVAGYQGETIMLGRLADGALAMRKDTLAAGVMLLIPFVGSGQSWYRFENET